VREALLIKRSKYQHRAGRQGVPAHRRCATGRAAEERRSSPKSYKVAVVGRFKTGKSSFVNELLGARLASEDTNPETAAITSVQATAPQRQGHGPVRRRRTGVAQAPGLCTPTTRTTSTRTG
jgi:ribosome biogenesis GTPase A